MEKVNMIDNVIFNKNNVTITPLIETALSQEKRILLAKDQTMKAHKTKFPIIVEIFEGEIDFIVDETVHRLSRGDMISLKANILHSLKAHEDSIIRLTLLKKLF